LAVLHPRTYLECMVIVDPLEANLLKSRIVHDQYRSELFEPSRDAHLGLGL
jgi:hypothetical protein